MFFDSKQWAVISRQQSAYEVTFPDVFADLWTS